MGIALTKKSVGLIGGFLIFAGILISPPPAALSIEAWHTAGVAILMAVWWITEAIPIPATALVPVVLLPLLGAGDIGSVLQPYAHPLVFLFMGGFIIAIAMEKWNLHRRIALNIVSFVGIQSRSIILGFILASAFLSMWVSNTATALMMLPIALSVLQLVDQDEAASPSRYFGLCLLLGVAYGCNIGGMGTLIGTPPNALLAAFMQDSYGVEISFVNWLLFGLPFLAVALPLMHFILTRVVYPLPKGDLPGGKTLFDQKKKALGEISSAEKRVAVVFVATALLWITRPLLADIIPGLSDTGIAMTAALSFFFIPSGSQERGSILKWSDVESLPWGVLILFGGGLSLASAIDETGLAQWIGSGVQALAGWPFFLVILLLVVMIIFLTEMTSNTATAAAFLPIIGPVAVGVGQDPLLLALPVALAASCAFMLPVATPPNAIIYGSNKISIPEMTKAGLWLNLIFILLVSLWTYYGAPLIFNL